MLPSVNTKKTNAVKRPNSGTLKEFVSVHRGFAPPVSKEKPRLKTYGNDVIDRDISKLEIRNTVGTDEKINNVDKSENGLSNFENQRESKFHIDDSRPGSFSCETDTDSTTPWLLGISCVANENVLCLDLNNERLKRFDSRFNPCASIEISNENNGMTVVSDTEVALTCLNEVHFYNIGKFGLSRNSKYFRLGGVGYGISHNSNWFAVTCDIMYDDGTIRILDQDGNEQYIIASTEVSGHEVKFSNYVQLDEMSEKVLVSDADLPRVVCFSFQGEVLWEHKIDGGPRGILMIDDIIIVADQYGQKIEALTTTGQHKKTLLTSDDGIFNPDYLAFCKKRRKLFVTYRGFEMLGVFDPLL